MIAQTTGSGSSSSLTRARVLHLASIVCFGALPFMALVLLFVGTVQDDTVAFDFRPFYSAAGAVLHGHTPYPSAGDPLTAESGAYVYPPLGALVAIPLRALPLEAAGLLVMVLLAVCAVATLRVLGVRDWRCYGLVFLWPPVLSAIQTGNLTLLLGLCLALAWRYRDRTVPPAAAIGATLAAKLFLWPLVVWLAATRRIRTAVTTVVVGLGLLALSWAVIGFAGLTNYVDLMRRLERSIGRDAYTVRNVALDLGAPSTVATLAWLALGLSLVVAVVVMGRRGDDRSAFVLSIAAALALTPIVWLHYFALLLVVVAVAQPRLRAAWFVPLAMVVTPGSGHPTLFQVSATLTVAAVTFVLALHPLAVRRRPLAESVGGPRTGTGSLLA